MGTGATGLDPSSACVWMMDCLQVCTQASLTKAIRALEDSQAVESAPLILAALDRCRGLEAPVRDGLRLRLNLAAGQLGEAARDALELARREQVGLFADAVVFCAMSCVHSTLGQAGRCENP